MTTPIAPDRLIAFAAAVLAAHRVPDEDAHLFADSLVKADLWGHQSHGVMRLSWYVARLRTGVMQPVTRPEWITDAGAVAVLDGRDGVGQVIATHAMRDALRRAQAHGVGVVAVRNSNHFGTAMYYTRMAAAAGCIGILTTNASPAMAPWGGRRKAIGNNPWSIAAPCGHHPAMVLDIANTAVARGKIYLARQRGVPIPEGWAIDETGVPTTDPVRAVAGIIAPMAGHKGYAISVMMDVLAGVLTGSGFATGVHGPYQSEHRSGCGHLAVVLDVAKFMPLAEFESRMEALVAELRAVPLAPGAEAILYPGELETRNAERNARDGLILPDDTLADLAKLAGETGLEALLPFRA